MTDLVKQSDWEKDIGYRIYTLYLAWTEALFILYDITEAVYFCFAQCQANPYLFNLGLMGWIVSIFFISDLLQIADSGT